MEKIIEYRNLAKQYPRLFKIAKLTHPKSKKIIESFHIQEYAFKNFDTIPFLARGCFILNEDSKNTIVIRGYDKFFNVGEIKDTQWNNIEVNTNGPYELTLKENGCIIFVSVFENDLIVASKHSITKLNDKGILENNPYADLGEKWLNKYINGKREELIKFIKDNNVTLVFELIDNEFEEHVLEYSKEEEGLYLHGINTNTVEFNTWPSEKVNEVAKQFNLIPVKYKLYNTINELKEFADSCKGYYNGRAIEGWVIRCKKKNGDTFFFKYKYDEPYLLYREWREATKTYISHKPIKYHYNKTYDYMDWVKEKYQTNKELFIDILNKRGIIKLRNLYLEESQGGKRIKKVLEPLTKENAKFKLILPIGIIGFGKTTIGKMLQILYDIGHIQNDNYQKKQSGFIADIYKEFDNKTIVMADKNNHLKILRGENHQNLTPEKAANYPHIIKSFLNNFENLDTINNTEDSLIDEVINIDFKEDSISIVKKIINALNLEPKTDEELKEALKLSKKVNHNNNNSKAKIIQPLYYGLRLKYVNCKDFTLNCFKKFTQENDLYIKEYEKIKFIIENGNFLQREHIAVACRKTDSPEILKFYDNLLSKTKVIKSFNNPYLEAVVYVSSIVWTSNHIFIPVDKIKTDKILDINNNNNSSYYITVACYGDAMPNECLTILQNIKNFYQEHTNLKPEITEDEEKIIMIDESFVIDDSNKEKEKEITHPKTLIQLLAPPLKDTSFIKPINVVEGSDWKQLFFEPFKFKGFYTKKINGSDKRK
ncbi:hypothetical protein BCR32DRAFT_292097 [Anaeromyces robustus]|uniref:tRNA ligase n=1 Tax=Anaeromyces robustus TaxID=1754192 RepID=A0A1Y1XBY7_9FUNG|nr:hypothetical protein BCR32DRAFT_292097 [Anaeromyces robustus]|eukprot:ORX83280.1 hypothetical protein BCR32DRAFT_292097 [Anaeromyces robustus]